jgi:enediyne biosynthesis protein E4
MLSALLCAACSSPSEQEPILVIEEPDMKASDMQAPDLAGDPDLAEQPDLAPDLAPDMAPVVCASASSFWSPGTKAFEEMTERAGFVQMGIEAVRLSTTDIDGDGFVDLIVRRGGLREDVLTGAPDAARHTWLLRNKGDGSFEDVTLASGLLVRRDGNTALGRPIEVVASADVDNDGDIDIATMFSNADPAALNPEAAEIMLNNGDGTYALGPATGAYRAAGQAVVRGGAAFVDADRDGKIDLWVGHGAPKDSNPAQDRLYAGDGEGGFQDQTSTYGLTTKNWNLISELNQALAHTNSWGVNACDLDGDGTTELLSASYGRAPNHLWRGVRDAGGGVTFMNSSIASGYAFDQRTDWATGEGARCYCKLHPEAEGCAGAAAPMYIRCDTEADVFRWNHAQDRNPFRLGGNSGTTSCGDVNNDGKLDLLTSEIVHWDVGTASDPSELMINDGDAVFARPGSEVTGLAPVHEEIAWNDGDITGALFDFDNDGRLDVLINSTDYPGTRARLYHQKADGTFELVSLVDGIDHKSSHGVIVADIDNDGDLDLILGHSRSRCSSGDHCYEKSTTRVFENKVGSAGNWMQLDLVGGAGTNRAAIGARITVETPDGMIQVREVEGGHGHYGIQHPLRQHFGLGASCTAKVTVRWPDAALTTETFELAGNKVTKLTQKP